MIAEQFQATPWKFDGERGRVTDAFLALAAEVPDAVGPVHELVAGDIGFTALLFLPDFLVEDDDRLDWGDHVGRRGGHPGTPGGAA